MENNLIAVVMCGGKSIRMGTDKGLLSKESITWAELAYKKLNALGILAYISINSLQKESYQKIFDPNLLIEDSIDAPGPLAGLLSAYNSFKGSDVLILACDMPDISTNTIQNLIYEYVEKVGEHDFFVFKNEEAYEPMLGIYSNEGLEKIFNLFLNKNLDKYSMKHILEISNTYPISLRNEMKNEFRNYNEQRDLI